MTTDQNKITARKLVDEGYAKRNWKLLDETYAPDAINHDPNQPNLGKGAQGVKASMEPYFTAFPDLKIFVEREIAEGDLVAQHVRTIGTNTGQLNGMPATNKKTNVTGVITTKFKDGKVVETWALFDQLGLMQQLGVIKTPETAKPELVGSAR